MMMLGPLLRGWRRDERGTITVEFMLWTPVLCFWLVASAAFFDAYKSRNDAAKAVHTLADIASRQIEMTTGFLNELYVLESNLLPRSPEGTQLRVSSIQYFATDDTYQVQWSQPLGGGQPLASVDIPLALLPDMADFDTVVLTELVVPYQPFTNWAKIEITNWSFALVSRPRFVSAIAKVD